MNPRLDHDRAVGGRRTGAIAALIIAVGAALVGGSVTIFGPRTLVRTAGPPNIFTFTFSAAGTAGPYVLHIDNHGVTSAVVTLNGVQILGPSDFKATKGDDWKKSREWDDDDWERDDSEKDGGKDSKDRGNDSKKDRENDSKDRDDDWRKDHDWKAVIERTVTLRPSNTLRVELRSKPGTHLSIRITGADAAPPTITATATPAANAAGWNRTNVQVTFTCAGRGSAITSCTAPVLVTNEGRGQLITGRAVNAAGSTATASVTLNIDKTAPTIDASIQPPPNESGWVNQNATVSFACADQLSGVASCSAPAGVSTDGSNQIVRGTVADVAGNSSTASIGVNVDKTAPVITAVVSPEPNEQGWNRGDVTVTFTCADDRSGIAACPPPVTVSAQGAGQHISGTARDRAGNTASTSVTVNIDKTAPAISVSSVPAPNADGWNNTDVTVSFTCGDGDAGVVSCPAPVTLTAEGAQQTISRTVTDQAGNTATATAAISIDKTAPTMTATALPPPNPLGWSDANVTVTFACADQLSGIATCPPPVSSPNEGPLQNISGTTVDKAGNAAAASITLNIDKTPVSIVPAVQPPPNAAGWNNTNVTVTFACQDTGSGVGSCPPPAAVTSEGAGQVISGTGADLAGNRSAASVTVNVDKTPPQILAAVTPPPNADGWLSRDAIVSFACADPDGSGIATCAAPVTLGEGAAQQVLGSASDVAGNSAMATAVASVDKTPPAISYTISPQPNAAGWIDSDATVTFVCSDAGSGIKSCPPAVTVTTEGAGQTVAGTAVDNADNSAAITVTLNIDKTPAIISALVDPQPNANGWNRTNVLVTFTCSDNGSSAICPAPVTVTTEGAGQVITGRFTDLAGNIAETSVTLNIDKTAPTITAVATPGTNAAGWNRTDVAVTFTCSDGVSGVASCPAPTTVSAESAGQTLAGTAMDRAGNAETASVVVKIDKTPPTVTIASPAPGATLATSPTALGGTASDALSGIGSAACNGVPAVLGAGGSLSCAATLVNGQNTLTLTAIDAAGNTTTSQVDVTFVSNRPPLANAGAGYSGAPGVPIAFSADGSSDPDSDSLTYAWNFGDGTNGSGSSVTHAYTQAGTFTVTLTLTDSRGATTVATTRAAIVQPNRAPTATANGPYAGVTAASIAFSGTASDPDGDALTYTWAFGDGTTATGLNASHVYIAPKTYTATLTVSDGQLGGSSTASVQIAQANRAPTVSAGGGYSGVNGAAVNFAASATDQDGDALTYVWDFGDGGNGAGQTASHVYAAPGNYTVSVIVNDGRGGLANGSAAAAIAQANRPPRASAGGPYVGNARTRILFDGSATTDPDNNTLTYAWDFGDGATGTGASPNHGYAAEGAYTVKLTVDDGRGGKDLASASVSITPAVPVVNQPPLARPGGPYTGQAGVVLTLNGSSSTDADNDALTFSWDFGDGNTGTGPAPTHIFATDGSFMVTMTVDDAHGHTTAAVTSAAIAPASDRAPPNVSLSAPARVLPGTSITVTASATDNVGIASVTFEVDGTPTTLTAPPFQRIISVPAVAAPGAQILVRADAADAAGNIGTAQVTLTIDAVPDTENPTVMLNGPADATPGSTIHLTATASDNVGVASVTFSSEGSPIATVPVAPYESIYTVPANAAPGSLLTFAARATDFTGNHTDATAAVVVASNSDTTAPTVSVAAPQSIAPGGVLPITVDATDDAGIASVSLYVEGVQIARVAKPPYGAEFNVPSSADAGSILHLEARAEDFSGNEGRAAANTVVVVAGRAVVIGEVYDDSTGLLLPGASVALTGTDQSGAPYTETTQADGRGRFVIHAAAGHGVITAANAGMTRVARPVDLQNGMVVEVLDSRLTTLTAPGAAVSGVLGGSVSSGGAVLTVGGGGGLGSTTFRVTTVSARGLGGRLPRGWSPVAVVDIAPHGTAIAGSAFAVENALHFAAGTAFVAARWDEAATAWRAIGDAIVSTDALTIRTAIEAAGQYAILIGDTQPFAPAHPNAGELVSGVNASPVPADAVSLVTPQPKVLFYSPGVKADVAGLLTSLAPLPSGTVIWSRITESYQFFSGAEIHPEPYTADVVFYQLTNDPYKQRAVYAVTPSLTFEPQTLQSGVITVELFAPPATPSPIATVASSGGTLTAATGESIHVPPGAGSDDIPIQIRGLSAAQLGLPMPAGVDLIGAMRLDFTGTLALPATLSVPTPLSLGDTTGILLVRLQELEGQTRLVLVGLGRVAGDRVISDVALAGTSHVFEGVRVAGRYAFVHMHALTAFAAGRVLGAVAPLTGALVTTPALPVVSLSRGIDGYIAVGGLGTAAFTAKDLQRSDLASASLTFTSPDQVLPLDLHLVAQPPRVASILPSDGSTSVALGTAVMVTFSKPIDPATLSGAQAGNIILTAADGTVVTSTLSLSARNSVATVRPVSPLQANTAYTVTVSPAIADLSGSQLGAAVSAQFTSLDTVAPAPPPAGAVAATIPVNGVATVTATQGTAGAHDHVTIVNVTTGAITPVLLDPNGGFTAAVSATAKDKLRLTIVDAAGNETTLDLPRFTQSNPDGSLSAAVDATGAHIDGPGGSAVDVPAGALPDGSVVTIKLVAEADFPVRLTDDQKQIFTFSGGLSIDFGGVKPSRYVNVSIPAGPNDTATDQWVVNQVAMVGGIERLNVVDTARVIEGRITTSSPPCPGVTGQGVYGIYKSKRPVGVNYGQMGPGLVVDINVYGQLSGTLADTLLLPWASLVTGLPVQAPVCIPVLTGNVTINPNTVQVAIAGTDLTPADREIVITNVTKSAELHFPRDVVEYAFVVQGRDSDRFDVTVTTPAGVEQPVNRRFFDVADKSSGTVTVTLNADKIDVPVAKVTIKDLTVNPVRVDTFADSLIAMKFDVAGAAGDQYLVEAIDVTGAARPLTPTVTGPPPPIDTGNLVARAVTGTIDPTRDQILEHNAADPAHPISPSLGRSAVYLGDLESGGANTTCGTTNCIRVPEDQIINGGFTIAVTGNERHRWMIAVVYDNGKVDTQALPFFEMRIRNQLTGKIIRTIARQAPPRGQPSNLGTIAADDAPPLITSGPPRMKDFDPSSPLTISFSQAMDRSTLTASTFIVEKLQQDLSWRPIDGTVQVSADATSATFVPTAGLAMGEDYRVRFSGAKSAGGKLLLYQPLFLSTFKPHGLCPPNTQCDQTFITPDDPQLGAPLQLKDVAYLRKTDPSGQQKTFLVAITSSNGGVKLMTFDVTNPGAPVQLGEEFGGARKQRVTLVPNASIALHGENGCGPAPHLTSFDGDLAVTSTFNSYYTFVSFFDLRDLGHPCLMANKLLTATPDFLSSYSIPGTLHAAGFGRGVATLTYPHGLVAYTAVGEVGLMSADAGKNIPEQLPAERKREGMYPGDFQDVVAVGDQLLAIEKTSGDPPGALGLFDASLNRLMSFNLADAPRRLLYVPGLPVDLNGDHVMTRDEVRNVAFIASEHSIQYIDVTDLTAPASLGSIKMPGIVRDLDIDVARHRLYAGGDTGSTSVGSGGLFVIDISNLQLAGLIDNDQDPKGWDDRILWTTMYASGINGFRVDHERGVAYVANIRGLDVVAIGDICCDLGVDLTPKRPEVAHGDRDRLLRAELQAIQAGVAAGLTQASAACSVNPFGGRVTILEQGSGACTWRGGCDTNYQPGLSDHDFEVFIPASHFGPASINRPGRAPESQAQCFTNVINEQFTDPDTGDPIVFTIGSDRISFSDITFFPVRKEGFTSANLDILPPTSSGGDPTGDMGLGRQQLLLKWLLEGSYVTIPSSMIGGNAFTPSRDESLSAILSRLTERVGILAIEGLEWGILQEFNLIKSKAFIRLRGSSSTGSTFNDLFKKQVHDAAKAGIRSALAQLVTVPRGNRTVLTITRSAYEGACIAITPGTTDTWQPNQRCYSFEEYIASSAARDLMNGVQFGEAPVFTEPEVRQIYQFFRIKADRLDDPADAAILAAEDKADDFIASVARFIKGVQTDPRTTKAWDDNIATDPRGSQRISNRMGGEQARDTALTHGTFPVAVRAFNDGFAPANGVQLRMFRNAEQTGSGVEAKKLPITLPGGDAPPQWRNFKVGADIAGTNPPVEDPKNPYVDTSHPDGLTHAVAFVIDLPERSVKEPNRQNNWNGFFYYILDRNQTTHTVPSAPDKPPFPLAPDLLTEDTMCVDAPILSAIQTANNDRVRVTVFNNSDERLTDVIVCSDLALVCSQPISIAAHGAATIVLTIMVPPTTQVAASRVTVSGKDPGGHSVQLVATQQLVNVVSPIQVKLFDHTPLIEQEHPFSRFHANRIPTTVDLADIHGAVTDGTTKAIQIVADKLKPNVPVVVSLADSDFVEATDGVGELVFGTQHGTDIVVTPDQFGHLELFYTPPDTFIRDAFRKYDFDRDARGVTLLLHQEDVGTMARTIELRRPPVFLVHGLWGTIHVWKYFQPIVPPGQVMNDIIDTSLQFWFNSTWTDSNAQYFTPRKAFDGRMDIIAVGKPGASGHYDQGVKDLRSDIKLSLQEYLKGYAIGKVDLLGHSMGGVLSTKMTNDDPVVAAAVRKLIVLNSPLKGSPLADWVVQERNKIHPIKFDLNPVDFFNLDTAKGLTEGTKAAFKVDYCNLGLKLFGLTPAFNIYNGAIDDLKTTSMSPGFAVPTHYISTWTTGADLGYSAETTGMWTMLGYFCNMTPEQNTIEKTKLVKISAEIAKTLFGLAGAFKEESTATKFMSSSARKGVLKALKSGVALSADHAILGEDPTPIFGTEPNDRVVATSSQRGSMSSGDRTLTELAGLTDHQAAKITPKIPISACIGTDANGVPQIINAGAGLLHDLNGDGQPDIGCRVIELLEASPGSPLFKQP